MKRKISIIFVFLLWSCAACSKDVLLAYSDMRFQIPDGYSVIVSTDLMNGMLAFKYGEEKGRKFISFSDITNDSAIDYGCPPGEFYTELFSPSGKTKCNKRELDALSDVLLKDGITKIWKTPNTVFNYIEFGDSSGSSVFICKKDGGAIQVDSSFLTEDGFRKMFADLLEQ
jgi:hypothetical protein